MDPVRFDRLAKSLSISGTRRGALGGLLGGTLALLGLSNAAAKKRRKASAEGSCGDGSGKANACRKHKDCCTRFCDRKKGRCRCKTLGQGCKKDRTCCASFGQPMTCQNRTCQMAQTVQEPLSPPLPVCPPVCPDCQICNPTTGRCEPENICQPTSCDNQINKCGQTVNCCRQAGATNPGCEGGACCELTVAPGQSFCSATVPCCQDSKPGSRSCIRGHCCVNRNFTTAEEDQCCSGSYASGTTCK